jgi:serine/threonine-protein kinase
MEPQPGELIAGKLQVIRRLGAGGVGSVWEVEHTLTRHRRALKLLHPRFLERPEVIERFLREASAAGRIGNPHIVEAFDAGKLESGEPYLLMELLQGEPLSARVRLGAMDAANVAWTVREACLGVAAAHDAGIVHRDLKPDNLFLCSGPDGKPFVKVLDFGVSHFEEPGSARLTETGVTLGTPLYMSPEQISGLPDVDKRTDVYALGVILYEAVSGRPPYDGVSLAALAVKIHQGQPPPLATLRTDLPPGFDKVVEKAMHVDRAQRFQDVRELYDALAPFEAVPGALELTHAAGMGAPTAPARPFPPSTVPVASNSGSGSSPVWLLLAVLALGAPVLFYFLRQTPPAPLTPPQPRPEPPVVVVTPASPPVEPIAIAPADAGAPPPVEHKRPKPVDDIERKTPEGL